MAPRVYISYAQSDAHFGDALAKHLCPLQLAGELEIWRESNLQAGDERQTEARRQLETADLIVLLISSDFFDSTRCWQEEMPRVLEQHENGDARLIPVVIRPCQWQATPLGQLQAIPRDHRAVTQWEQEDDAWEEVVRGIRAAISSEPPPEDEALRTWLERVRSDHETLVPYFTEKGAPLLEQIYVEVQLSHEHDRRHGGDRYSEEPNTEPLPSHLSISQVLELEPEVYPWVTRRWLLRGAPGAGKTTLVRHLALTLARSGGVPWVPIFASLPKWLREPEWLLDRIEKELDRAGDQGQEICASLEALGRQGRLLLLLDGLDEVPRECRDETATLLRRLDRRWPESQIVVTSRPIGAPSPHPSFVELELLPFDVERRRLFLERWLDDTRAAELDHLLASDPSLAELADNPLYLTLMALLYDRGRRPERLRSKLYDQVFDLLLDGEHRATSEPIAAQAAVREVLRRIAFDLTHENRDALPVAELEARLLSRDFAESRQRLEEIRRWRDKPRVFLDDVAERTGILGPHDGSNLDWRFWHRTFREALVADELEKRLQLDSLRDSATAPPKPGLKGTPARFRRWWQERQALDHARRIRDDVSRWAEPYALLAGRLEHPDELVKALMRVNRPLGLRAMATTQELSDETLAEILALSDDWQERRKVYERIPELIDEPERALALLDQLRRRTRNGNDLYFIASAVESVGRRWPEARGTAEQVQGRLFDHIPQPSQDLFQWIETLDGRVDLWRRIAAGSFRMGSPEEEAGSYNDEHPQHRVNVRSPFRIGVVPVTIAQYRAFDPEHRSFHEKRTTEDPMDLRPVESVTWYEASAFCRWLASCCSWAKGARLPSEEEWEYACRASTETPYWSGEKESDLERVGWYYPNSGNRTHRVGLKPANPWGLYDVHGNVWEWTLSEWDAGKYAQRKEPVEMDPSAVEPPEAPAGGARVCRGGCYWDTVWIARCAFRNRFDPEFWVRNRGFRVLLSAPEPFDS